MKINRIELFNIGSYEGINSFDIAAQKRMGHVTVIGGKNGAGKTTLFAGIKLCLYGHREAGYQSINAWYKNSIKKLINDKSKLENNSNAYVELSLSLFNGQTWDEYVLKRFWNLNDSQFETFTVSRNDELLDDSEIVDFDNYLMSLIPPELFNLYFFDGEQIADYFLDDSNGARVKNAFLTICGYDTFDILYKNFKRLSKGSECDNEALNEYFESEEDLKKKKNLLQSCNENIEKLDNLIIQYDSELKALEKRFSSKGGVSITEWNDKLLDLKNEERIRDEKNQWIKMAANDIIPFLILRKQLEQLLEQMDKEKEIEQNEALSQAVQNIIPDTLKQLQKSNPEMTDELNHAILASIVERIESRTGAAESVLNLSKAEYQQLLVTISKLLEYKKENVIASRTEVKESIKRSQKRREDIDQSNISELDDYLKDKETLINLKSNAAQEKSEKLDDQKGIELLYERASQRFKLADKALEKHLKSSSVADLTTKSILFLDELQKRLFDSELRKVEHLFIQKMNQLMRKDKFIQDIKIDNDFNIHVYKQIRIDADKVCDTINKTSIKAYISEFGTTHCDDILKVSGCSNLEEFVSKYTKKNTKFDTVIEFDKSTMSKGEKQVFIMALYWAIMQLCNKEIPFIIDTPFARIDTEHRAHITEYFFKELRGQVMIFSTDEEITPEHMSVIGDDLQSKFLIENTDNKKTAITANKYFGE